MSNEKNGQWVESYLAEDFLKNLSYDAEKRYIDSISIDLEKNQYDEVEVGSIDICDMIQDIYVDILQHIMQFLLEVNYDVPEEIVTKYKNIVDINSVVFDEDKSEMIEHLQKALNEL